MSCADLEQQLTLLLQKSFDERPSEMGELADVSASQHQLFQQYPFFQAVLEAGFDSNRLAWVFMAAYQAAVANVTRLRPGGLAFCYSEKGSQSPRSLQTQIQQKQGGHSVSGAKGFVAGAATASQLVVVGKSDTELNDMGEPMLQAALVELSDKTRGVSISDPKQVGFIEEYPHAAASFEDVTVSQILPGDAYLCYAKPLRVNEAFFFAVGLSGFLIAQVKDRQLQQDILFHLYALNGMQSALLNMTAVAELALWQQLRALKQLFLNWLEHAEGEIAESCKKDQLILMLFEKTAQARESKAWQFIQEK